MPRDGFDDSAALVRIMMNYLSGAEGSDVDVVARDNTVRVTGGAIVRFQLQRALRVASANDPGYSDQGYHYHLDRDHYR